MTIQDASNELFTWFETNDSFEANRDLRKIVPIMDDEEVTLIAFKIALEKLEAMELITSKDYGDKKYYILEKHMDAFQQSVEVGPWSAKFISGEINDFCSLVQDNTDLCQTSNILEKDIRNLVHIILFYKQKLMEKEDIISSNDGVASILGDLNLSDFIKPPSEESDESGDEDEKKKK